MSSKSGNKAIKTAFNPVVWAIGAVVILLIFLVGGKSLFEEVNSDEICVIQYPITGKLNVYTTPGLKPQWFGSSSTYPKSDQLWLGMNPEDPEGEARQAARIRFNDAGSASVYASARWFMPLETEKILDLHIQYGGDWKAVRSDLVGVVLTKAIYNTGQLMSSRESYSERRSDLITLIEDMSNNGVYATRSNETKIVDVFSGEEKTVTLVEPLFEDGAPGGIKRQEISPLDRFGVQLSNFAINKIEYDERVLDQINAQRDATMKIQTAIAEAKEAEQRAIKVEADGKANAAQAKWTQEVEKATFVTKAEQEKEIATIEAEKKRDVAKLQKEAAEFTKQEQILLGQGEAERKRLVLNADGALQQKLDTWIEGQKVWAGAFANYKGNVVPQVVTGGDGNTGNAAVNFMELMGINAARQLSLDMSVPQGTTR